MPDPPSYSAVRAMLRVLEEKGHVRHEQDGPRYVYLPRVARDRAKRSALRHLVRTFFDGSAEQVVAALLDDRTTHSPTTTWIAWPASSTGRARKEPEDEPAHHRLFATSSLKATLCSAWRRLAAARARARLRRHAPSGLDARRRGRAPAARPARHRPALGAAAAARRSDRRAHRVRSRARRRRPVDRRGRRGAAGRRRRSLPRLPRPRRRAAARGLDPASLARPRLARRRRARRGAAARGHAPRLAHGRRRGAFASPAGRAAARRRGSLSLGAPVRLLRGRPQTMPMAWGLLRPAVLLPEDAEAWPGEQRRAVLTHELAHVKRHDCLTQALAHAACALYWFHPLVWLAAWRLRVERERACDDLVLRAGASGPDYADHLLQLARGARAGAGPGLGARDGAALAARGPPARDPRPLARTARLRSRRGRLAVAAAALLAVVLGGPRAVGSAVSASTTLAFETLGADALATPSRPEPAAAAAAAPRGAPSRRPSSRRTAGPSASRGAFDSVVAALTEAVRDSDAEVRRQAVHTLGEMRAESAAPRWRAPWDEDGEVRAQAAVALGELRSSAAVEALGKALADDTEAEVRKQAAFALGEIRSEAAVGPTAALTDKDAEVRAAGGVRARRAARQEAIGPLSRRSRTPRPTCASRRPSRSARSARAGGARPVEALKDACPTCASRPPSRSARSATSARATRSRAQGRRPRCGGRRPSRSASWPAAGRRTRTRTRRTRIQIPIRIRIRNATRGRAPSLSCSG